ncbi:MAG: bacteriocin transport accessory protein [Lachnospiraceae bacterium]|nr:bacteriocin transport accessory protein [Lachnospiraceae bacterium]
MKKIAKKLRLAPLFMICFGMLISCGTKEPTANERVPESALEILNTVWDNYGEEERFSAAGGDYTEENMVEGAPGKFGILDTNNLDYTFGIPENSAYLLDDCASLMHMMNSNSFTAGAFHIKQTEEVPSFMESLKDNIMARQWICGFPDKVIIVQIGDYVVSAFGNNEMIDTFKSKLTNAYDQAVVVYQEDIL